MYPAAPPMLGKGPGGRLCAAARTAFPKKVAEVLHGVLCLNKPHLALQALRECSDPLPFGTTITCKCVCLPQLQVTDIHSEEQSRLHLQSKAFFVCVCGKRTFTCRNKYAFISRFQDERIHVIALQIFWYHVPKPQNRARSPSLLLET